jgi:hypothetical protein
MMDESAEFPRPSSEVDPNAKFWRKVHKDRLPEPGADLGTCFSPQHFDRNGVSISLVRTDYSPDRMVSVKSDMVKVDSFGVLEIPARAFQELGFILKRDPNKCDDGHFLIENLLYDDKKTWKKDAEKQIILRKLGLFAKVLDGLYPKTTEFWCNPNEKTIP